MNPKLKKVLEIRYNPRWSGGPTCSICCLKRAKEINQDILDFFKEKKGGHPMPCAAFVRDYLNPEYGLSLRPDTIRNHAKRCLRLEI